MHLYTGLRRPGARLLMRAPCVRVDSIFIDTERRIFLEGVQLSQDECEALALRDGFESFLDMMSFWDGRLPFTGHIYHWDPRKRIA